MQQSPLIVHSEQKQSTRPFDFQNDFLGVENRRWILASPDRTPILKSEQVSLGFNYNPKTLQFNAEFYLKNVNGITSQSQGFQNQFQFVRSNGSYTIKGADFLVKKRFKKANTWLSYSVSQNLYNFENLNPSRFLNNIDITHVLTLGVSGEYKQLKIAAGLNYHSGRAHTLPLNTQAEEGEIISFDFPNAARLKPYYRFDVSATHPLKLSKNTVYFYFSPYIFMKFSIFCLLDSERSKFIYNTVNMKYIYKFFMIIV